MQRETNMKIGIPLKLTPESCVLHLYVGKNDYVILGNQLMVAKLLIA